MQESSGGLGVKKSRREPRLSLARPTHFLQYLYENSTNGNSFDRYVLYILVSAGLRRCGREGKGHHIFMLTQPWSSTRDLDDLAKESFVAGAGRFTIEYIPVAAAVALKKSTVLIVSIGEQHTFISPVIQGQLHLPAVQRSGITGFAMTRYLKEVLLEESQSLSVAKYIKEHHCFIADDYKQHEALNKGKLRRVTIGTGSKISISQHALASCGEILFKPKLVRRFKEEMMASRSSSTQPLDWDSSIHKLIHKSILQCPPEFQSELFKNIYIEGESAKFPGLTKRLKAELIQMVFRTQIGVYICPKYTAWKGGAELSSKLCPKSITRAEYQASRNREALIRKRLKPMETFEEAFKYSSRSSSPSNSTEFKLNSKARSSSSSLGSLTDLADLSDRSTYPSPTNSRIPPRIKNSFRTSTIGTSSSSLAGIEDLSERISAMPSKENLSPQPSRSSPKVVAHKIPYGEPIIDLSIPSTSEIATSSNQIITDELDDMFVRDNLKIIKRNRNSSHIPHLSKNEITESKNSEEIDIENLVDDTEFSGTPDSKDVSSTLSSAVCTDSEVEKSAKTPKIESNVNIDNSQSDFPPPRVVARSVKTTGKKFLEKRRKGKVELPESESESDTPSKTTELPPRHKANKRLSTTSKVSDQIDLYDSLSTNSSNPAKTSSSHNYPRKNSPSLSGSQPKKLYLSGKPSLYLQESTIKFLQDLAPNIIAYWNFLHETLNPNIIHQLKDRDFLEHTVIPRYQRFVHLKQTVDYETSKYIIPDIYIAVAWQAHMCRPSHYRDYSRDHYNGKILPHTLQNAEFATVAGKGSHAATITSKAWKKAFNGESFIKTIPKEKPMPSGGSASSLLSSSSSSRSKKELPSTGSGGSTGSQTTKKGLFRRHSSASPRDSGHILGFDLASAIVEDLEAIPKYFASVVIASENSINAKNILSPRSIELLLKPYEQFFYLLLKYGNKHNLGYFIPPPFVEFSWRAHMIAPQFYLADCKAYVRHLLGKTPSETPCDFEKSIKQLVNLLPPRDPLIIAPPEEKDITKRLPQSPSEFFPFLCQVEFGGPLENSIRPCPVLPTEVLQFIFKKIPTCSLSHSEVCRDWYNAANSNDVWASHCRHDFPQLSANLPKRRLRNVYQGILSEELGEAVVFDIGAARVRVGNAAENAGNRSVESSIVDDEVSSKRAENEDDVSDLSGSGRPSAAAVEGSSEASGTAWQHPGPKHVFQSVIRRAIQKKK